MRRSRRPLLVAAPLVWLALTGCETAGDRPADTVIGTALSDDTGRASPLPPTGAATTARSAGGVVRATLDDSALTLAADTLPAGRARFVLVNESAHSYELTLTGNGDEFSVPSLPSGAMELLIADLRPGTYTLRAAAPRGVPSLEAGVLVQ